MPKAMSRDELSLRAAKVRAILIAGLNVGGPKTHKELCDIHQDDFHPIGAEDATIRNILDRAVASNFIFKRREGRSAVYYTLANDGSEEREATEGTGVEATLGATASKASKTKGLSIKAAALPAPSLILDIVKSTGRIRLEVGGFIIDIGIKD